MKERGLLGKIANLALRPATKPVADRRQAIVEDQQQQRVKAQSDNFWEGLRAASKERDK